MSEQYLFDLLTPSELAIILRDAPDWYFPDRSKTNVPRIEAARSLLASGGVAAIDEPLASKLLETRRLASMRDKRRLEDRLAELVGRMTAVAKHRADAKRHNNSTRRRAA